MKKDEIIKMDSKDFRDWMCRLSKDKRVSEIALISKIRLGGSSEVLRELRTLRSQADSLHK